MKKKINFEYALENLEKIIDRLEKGEETLDNSIKLYREGAELISECKTMLNGAESEISIINGENQLQDDVQ